MRHVHFLGVLAFLFVPPVDAQVVRGRVVDASGGEPIPGVNVFVAHTTLGAATDGSGHYVITGVPLGPSEVAASSLGYTPASRQITVGQGEVEVDFELEPVTYELKGVEISAERDRDWERLFERFEKQFLGTTPNSRSTEIVNPYIVDLQREDGLLTARASEPIVFENRALGYRVTFILKEFTLDERTHELRLEGLPYFEDLPDEDLTRMRRREEAFLGSMKHMLWAAIRGRLSEEGFRIHPPKLDRIPPEDEWTRFEPAVTGLTESDIIDETMIEGVYSLRFDGHLQVTYQRSSRPFPFGLGLGPSTQNSWLKLNDFRALVQDDGTPYFDTPVVVAGYMSIKRLADLLPRDHVVQLERTLLEGPKREKVELPGETAFPQEPGRIHPAESRGAEPAVEAMKERKWLRAIDILDAVLKHNPEDLEARYYRAIAHREIAKFQALLHFKHYGQGLDDFAFVLARDSTYRDILYQYALFSRVEPTLLTDQTRVEMEDALMLAHEQARLRPDVGEHEYRLFTLYRRFINNRDAAAALKWLDGHPSPWAAFFKAELLRRNGQLYSAEASLAGLLEGDPGIRRQPILLSLARLYYERGDPERAQALVIEAIESIERTLDAAFVFEDFKYVVDGNELNEYRSLNTVQELIAFFRAFWARRNPLPANRIDLRLAEHYRRLVYAEKNYAFDGYRFWFDNPDKAGELPFPASYPLDGEFNDKGHLYIRLGEPTDRIATVTGGMSLCASGMRFDATAFAENACWMPNESWRYAGLDVDFHFVIDQDAVGNNWRLTPVIANRAMLEDRMEWGGTYVQMARAFLDDPSTRDLDLLEGRHAMADESRQSVERGLTMDRHTWGEDVEPLEFPYLSASFRGEAGETLLMLYYALPLSGSVEVGAAVHDMAWARIRQETKLVEVPAGLLAVQGIRFRVPPDSYHVAIHLRPQGSPMLGGYRFTVRAPDFGRGELSASDLLLAFRIPSPSEVHVNPSGRFALDQLVHVYFEIYDLTFGVSDLTDYSVEFTLTPLKKKSLLRRLLGGSSETRALMTRHQGTTASPVESAEIDVRDVNPGEYMLTVKVTDENSGQWVERRREIELVE